MLPKYEKEFEEFDAEYTKEYERVKHSLSEDEMLAVAEAKEKRYLDYRSMIAYANDSRRREREADVNKYLDLAKKVSQDDYEKIKSVAEDAYIEEEPVDPFNFKYWERGKDQFVTGFIEGYLNETYEMARNCLDVLDDETSAKVFGLSVETVQALRVEIM